MKFSISCPHTCCYRKKKFEVEVDFSLLEGCGLVGCKGVAFSSIQSGLNHIKVCKDHYDQYHNKEEITLYG